MITARILYVMVIATAGLLLGACSPKPASELPAASQNLQVLANVRETVVGGSHYAAADVDITRNEYRIAISLISQPANSSDAAALEAEASTIVSAVERILPTNPALSQIQVISIAYVHRHGTADTHTDDVFEFRKTQGNSFQHHQT